MRSRTQRSDAGRRIGVAALTALAVLLMGCVAEGGEEPASNASAEAPARHLIYLHGRIVQDQQNPRPEHPRFGPYELDKIRETFEDRGFVVSAEIRPKSASVSESADRVVEQVQGLLDSGVPADRITVVGGSMGAAIGLLASTRLGNPGLRFAVLGSCLSNSVLYLESEEGRGPSGHILSIREASDDFAGPCPPWEEGASPGDSLVVRELVLDTGLSHGFLYRPLPEWVEPVVEWANRR